MIHMSVAIFYEIWVTNCMSTSLSKNQLFLYTKIKKATASPKAALERLEDDRNLSIQLVFVYLFFTVVQIGCCVVLFESEGVSTFTLLFIFTSALTLALAFITHIPRSDLEVVSNLLSIELNEYNVAIGATL